MIHTVNRSSLGKAAQTSPSELARNKELIIHLNGVTEATGDLSFNTTHQGRQDHGIAVSLRVGNPGIKDDLFANIKVEVFDDINLVIKLINRIEKIVHAIASSQLITPGAATNQIITTTSINHIITGTTPEEIVKTRSRDRVIGCT